MEKWIVDKDGVYILNASEETLVELSRVREGQWHVCLLIANLDIESPRPCVPIFSRSFLFGCADKQKELYEARKKALSHVWKFLFDLSDKVMKAATDDE